MGTTAFFFGISQRRFEKATAAMSGDYRECNFDSIVGLTHNYAGLSFGNVASTKHQNEVSFPRQAALQGLEKMKHLMEMGIPQAIIPPLLRPRIDWLRQLGFYGSPEQVIVQAGQEDPLLLAAAYSASSMWAANAATVSPSLDTLDNRVHFSPANLGSSLHRSVEADQITPLFRSIFSDAKLFQVHDPLPPASGLSDEGAANHTRLCANHGDCGIELLVYGRNALDFSAVAPQRFPARQTYQASQAIGRRHLLKADCAFLCQQNPDAIDAGVFHNDVISVGNQNVLLVHQQAFVNQMQVLSELSDRFAVLTGSTLQVVQVPTSLLPLQDAVDSYLFNSQLVSTAEGEMRLVSPVDCQSNENAQATIAWILNEDNPVKGIDYVDLRQSMNNGGGPACLRLRVVLNRQQREATNGRIWFCETLFDQLCQWIETHYPQQIEVQDLKDPKLLDRSFKACLALENIVQLPLVKIFQEAVK